MLQVLDVSWEEQIIERLPLEGEGLTDLILGVGQEPILFHLVPRQPALVGTAGCLITSTTSTRYATNEEPTAARRELIPVGDVSLVKLVVSFDKDLIDVDGATKELQLYVNLLSMP